MRRLLTLILLTSLMAVFGLAPTRRTSTSVRAGTKNDKNYAVVVQMAAGASVSQIASKYNLKLISSSPFDNRYLLSPPAGSDLKKLVSSISDESNVLDAETNSEMDAPTTSQGQPQNFDGGTPVILGASSSPYYSQTLTTFMMLNSVHSISVGQNVKVAVIDTGIDFFHPIFNDRIASGGYDFIDNDAIPFDECCGGSYGHGTFVAGLVLLTAPQAKILPIRIMDPNGLGNAFDVAAAIRYAVDQNAKVINLSLGTDTERPRIIKDAVEYAKKAGSIIVASAGNKNDGSGKMYPADEGYVLGVAATDFNNQKANFSNYGGCVKLTAPGVDLISAYPGGLYARWSGTSFSAPLVSAEAALLLAYETDSAAETIKVINDTAIDINSINKPLGLDKKLGKGRISPLDALNED